MIRVTTLESFRRFRDNVTETYDTEEKLIEHIKGEFKGNCKTEIGSAFHYLIETYGNGNLVFQSTILEKFGVNFKVEHFQIALDHAKNIFPFVPEIRKSKVFDTGKYKVEISGCTDVLQGNTLRDTKCKFSAPTYMDYYNSFQWRIYLSIFGLDRFLYDIFEFIGYKDEMIKDVSGLQLKQHDPFECIRYENMERDIITLINDFMDWIYFRNLQSWI